MARIRLKSGREFEANQGIVGISLTGDCEPLCEGYDGYIYTRDEYGEREDIWTDEERRELAEMVIERWRLWAENDSL